MNFICRMVLSIILICLQYTGHSNIFAQESLDFNSYINLSFSELIYKFEQAQKDDNQIQQLFYLNGIIFRHNLTEYGDRASHWKYLYTDLVTDIALQPHKAKLEQRIHYAWYLALLGRTRESLELWKGFPKEMREGTQRSLEVFIMGKWPILKDRERCSLFERFIRRYAFYACRVRELQDQRYDAELHNFSAEWLRYRSTYHHEALQSAYRAHVNESLHLLWPYISDDEKQKYDEFRKDINISQDREGQEGFFPVSTRRDILFSARVFMQILSELSRQRSSKSHSVAKRLAFQSLYNQHHLLATEIHYAFANRNDVKGILNEHILQLSQESLLYFTLSLANRSLPANKKNRDALAAALDKELNDKAPLNLGTLWEMIWIIRRQLGHNQDVIQPLFDESQPKHEAETKLRNLQSDLYPLAAALCVARDFRKPLPRWAARSASQQDPYGLFWYQSAGNYDRSIIERQQIIHLCPWHIGTINTIAWHYYRRKDWPEAEKMYRLITKHLPQHANTRRYLGHCLVQNGKRAEARDWWQESLSITKGSTKSFIQSALADEYEHIGKNDLAASLHFASTSSKRWEQYAAIARFYKRQNRWAESLRWYAKLFERNKSRVHALEYAWALRQAPQVLHNRDDIMQLLQDWLPKRGHFPELWDLFADVRMQNEQEFWVNSLAKGWRYDNETTWTYLMACIDLGNYEEVNTVTHHLMQSSRDADSRSLVVMLYYFSSQLTSTKAVDFDMFLTRVERTHATSSTRLMASYFQGFLNQEQLRNEAKRLGKSEELAFLFTLLEMSQGNRAAFQERLKGHIQELNKFENGKNAKLQASIESLLYWSIHVKADDWHTRSAAQEKSRKKKIPTADSSQEYEF